MDTGKDNALTFTQSGFDLGLNVAANTVQKAQNSIVNIDGFDVQRVDEPSGRRDPGVTLALTATTTAPVDVTVAADSKGLATKIQSIVTAYNSVLSQDQYGSRQGRDQGRQHRARQ